jgi:putative PIN family toxin of toxin-antitoxin system
MMQTPQVVIDTNVLVTAPRSKRGASSKLMSLIGTNRFDIHVSVPLVFEYEAVLLHHREQLALTPDDVADVVDAVCALAVPHKIYFLWRPYLRDRKDELVLELAVAARCDYIITYNQRDFRGVEMFGIRISDPRTFLQAIGELP